MSKTGITRKRTPEHNAKIGATLRARGQTPTKVCPGCKRDLDRKTMYRLRSSLAPGDQQRVRSLCIECEGPENAERNRRAQFKRKYGITPEDYDVMVEEQGGRCLLCRRAPVETGRRPLVVDHDHATGRVRGLLCDPCNTGIGLLRDDVEVLRRAIEYLS